MSVRSSARARRFGQIARFTIATSVALAIGLEIENVAEGHQVLHKFIHTLACRRRGLNDIGFTAPVTAGGQPVLGQLAVDAGDIAIAQVDFVQRHDDRHAG